MNCFTHALPFLHDPYFAVGTCIPDWLSSADRKCRAREKNALPFNDHDDNEIAALSKGIVQHHRDDDWFHQTPAFTELSLNFAVEIREELGGERGFRAGLLGHIVVELILDSILHSHHPGKLEQFYKLVASVDSKKIEQTVNLFATKETDRIAWYIERFIDERYLFDYCDDERLIYRVNNVFKRVKLKPLDDKILNWLPSARKRIANRAGELLNNYPILVESAP